MINLKLPGMSSSLLCSFPCFIASLLFLAPFFSLFMYLSFSLSPLLKSFSFHPSFPPLLYHKSHNLTNYLSNIFRENSFSISILFLFLPFLHQPFPLCSCSSPSLIFLPSTPFLPNFSLFLSSFFKTYPILLSFFT